MKEQLPSDIDLLDVDYLLACLSSEVSLYMQMRAETSQDPIQFYLGLLATAREQLSQQDGNGGAD